MRANQSAAANRRPAGQLDGSGNLAATVAADPARCGTAVAELDRSAILDNMYHLRCLFAPVLICTLIGCGENHDRESSAFEPSAKDNYNPIAVGLRWRSTVEITAPSGQVFRGTSIREITGMQSIGGKTYFVDTTKFTGLPGMEGFTTYRRKAEDGIYAINEFDPQKREYLETALPLVVGRTWTAVTTDSTVFTVEAQEDVALNGKAYEKCFKIVRSSDGLSPSGTFYLAPGVGTIMDLAKQGGVTYRFTLESFTGAK